jgi:hypothetical protein
MSGNKIIKSVSFNVTNEKDREYLERIKNTNFSGYVKRLIEKDIRQRKVIKTDNTPVHHLSNDGEIKVSGLSVIPN